LSYYFCNYRCNKEKKWLSPFIKNYTDNGYCLSFYDTSNHLVLVNEAKKTIVVLNAENKTLFECLYSDFISFNSSINKNEHTVISEWRDNISFCMIYSNLEQLPEIKKKMNAFITWLDSIKKSFFDQETCKYNLYKCQLQTPNNANEVHLIYKGIFEASIGNNLIWRVSDNLFLLPILEYDNFSINNKYLVTVISIAAIQFFTTEGDLTVENVLKGNGGGSSVKGAIIGELVAGETGAIIGSRKKININSQYIEHDTRMVVLSIMTTKGITTIKFNYIDLSIFKYLIPEKYL